IFSRCEAFLLRRRNLVSGPVRADHTRMVYRQVFRTAVEGRHWIAPHSHNLADKVVCLADGLWRIIDETGLRVPPFFGEPFLFLLTQRSNMILFCPLGAPFQGFLRT